MPSSDPAVVRQQGDALIFAGMLVRDTVATLWPQTLALLPGAACFDLHAVRAVDSAGLAMLAELAARARGPVAVLGDPSGLSGLRTAYRLDPGLDYAG